MAWTWTRRRPNSGAIKALLNLAPKRATRIKADGTLRQQAFAVVHSTLGDVMIAGLSLLLALAIFARATWPRVSVAGMASLAFGVGYTI